MTPNRVNRAHWPTKGNMFPVVFFFSVSGPWKKMLQMAPNGTLDDFFLLIQPLPTFWAERIWILRFFIFDIIWIPNFWVFRSPDFQNLAPGRAWAMLEPSGPARALRSAVAPRHSRTTKLVRSKELGQYRENPISGKPCLENIVLHVVNKNV